MTPSLLLGVKPMSKGSKVISVRVPDTLLGKIQKEMALQVQKGASTTIAMGKWIRAAMQQRLDHLARSRKKKAEPKMLCEYCQENRPASEIAYMWNDLVLQRQCKCCKACEAKRAGI